jgi:hypothetical protein
MTLREELLKIQEEIRAKYAKQKEAEAAFRTGQLSTLSKHVKRVFYRLCASLP